MLQNIYNIIENEFWKYTIFLSSKERVLENNLEIEDNDINYEQKDSRKEYEISDFSASDFGEYDLTDNNNSNININISKKNAINKNIADFNQDDMKLLILLIYFIFKKFIFYIINCLIY